jgi:hypothetical protein
MEAVMTPRKPLRCRLRFHRWEWAQTTDGEDYQRCARCPTERWTGLRNDRSVAANVIANYGSMN